MIGCEATPLLIIQSYMPIVTALFIWRFEL